MHWFSLSRKYCKDGEKVTVKCGFTGFIPPLQHLLVKVRQVCLDSSKTTQTTDYSECLRINNRRLVLPTAYWMGSGALCLTSVWALLSQGQMQKIFPQCIIFRFGSTELFSCFHFLFLLICFCVTFYILGLFGFVILYLFLSGYVVFNVFKLQCYSKFQYSKLLG